MTKPFYNTISTKGQTLINFSSKAQSQEDLILTVFKMSLRPLAWFEVKNLLIEDMNDCSIKRSITNLKTKGILAKTSDMIQGTAGKPVHKYKLT